MSDDVNSIVTNAAQRYGQDPSTLLRMGQIESGLNPSAYNAGSGASGMFQFVPSTARAYGLDNPQDPAASADAAARLMRDNRAALSKSLGRDPTGGELYLAHQQGAGGAAGLLSNPDAPAASIVGTKAVLSNGGSQGMTAGQFASKWTSKFDDTKPKLGSLGDLYASGSLPPNVPAIPKLPPLDDGTNRLASLAQMMSDDSSTAQSLPRPSSSSRGGPSALEAKRRALITGTNRLGALFA